MHLFDALSIAQLSYEKPSDIWILTLYPPSLLDERHMLADF